MKPTSTTTAAADLLKTGIEEYYCAYCNEEFGKNDPERGEHEDHDGYRKITIFQAFVLDQIKALEAQQTDDTLSGLRTKIFGRRYMVAPSGKVWLIIEKESDLA